MEFPKMPEKFSFFIGYGTGVLGATLFVLTAIFVCIKWSLLLYKWVANT